MSSAALDTVFNTFMVWQTILLCLGIGIITYFIRTLVEGLWKGAKANFYWNEVVLPLGPIGTGWLLVLVARSFPWPVIVMGSIWAKLFYGGACGVASGQVYSRFRSFITAAADTHQVAFTPIAQRMLGRKPGVKSDPPPPPPPSDPPQAA